jgi:hypothetical protein
LLEAQEVNITQKILYSLRFDVMLHRRDTVANTFATTYEWIFLSADELEARRGIRVHFQTWLQSGNGVYWISGKAGSGKSTLMKFLSSNSETKTALQSWAGTAKLVIASFFFYFYGADLERTQTGLFKALLFEILRTRPDLTKLLCPDRWSASGCNDYGTNDWNLAQLSEVIARLRAHDFLSGHFETRFCFFIDGLDEYDGDHNDIIAVLNEMSTSEHIKIVASSRPWNVFQEAFGQDKMKMLTLQELTFDDIHQYVEGKLLSDVLSASLEFDPCSLVDIAQEVTEMAQGVFLWVFLVVKELRKGIQNGDGLFDIRKRLKRIPPDLEPYFRRMFDNIDDFYREQAVQIFLICIRSKEALHLAALAELEPNDPLSNKFCGDENITGEDIASLHIRLAKRVNARCLDLMEAREHRRVWRLEFLHRTVRDFLATKDMLDMMLSWASAEFNPLLPLCNMQSLIFKRLRHLMPPGSYAKHRDDIKAGLVTQLFSLTAELEEVHSRTPHHALDALQRSLSSRSTVVLQQLLDSYKLWVDGMTLDCNALVLAFCVVYELYFYLKLSQERKGALPPREAGFLLCVAADNMCRASNSNPNKELPRTVQIIDLLIANGIEPNAEILGCTTPWLWFLFLLSDRLLELKCPPNESSKRVLLSIAEGFILNGAEYATAKLPFGPLQAVKRGHGQRLNEEKVLSWCFGDTEASRLANLRSHSMTRSVINAFRLPWWPR